MLACSAERMSGRTCQTGFISLIYGDICMLTPIVNLPDTYYYSYYITLLKLQPTAIKTRLIIVIMFFFVGNMETGYPCSCYKQFL